MMNKYILSRKSLVTFSNSTVSLMKCRFLSTTPSPQVENIDTIISNIKLENKSDHLQDFLKPKQLVEALDKFIIGQDEAKRAVAIALRNRWRRKLVAPELRDEIIPKNILMVGPTGSGKTEIARRIAKISQAPFVKVEATKYTETGFHGKDVDTIIRDLVDVAINQTKKNIRESKRHLVGPKVENKIIDAITGPYAEQQQIDSMRTLLKEGGLEQTVITIEVPIKETRQEDANQGGPNLVNLSELLRSTGKSKPKLESKQIPVSEARPILEEIELDKLVEEIDVVKESLEAVQQSGIVFIDEIDKLISDRSHRGADASSEGVQRDLLPLIEGCTISTKHGNVNTDYILFICSGAFHSARPSELMAEFHGRLPIRVTLKALSEEDFYRILTEPAHNLLIQQRELLKAEGVTLIFKEDAIREMARIAFICNKTTENTGARRLFSIVEKVMEDISYNACERSGETIEIDAAYVKTRAGDLLREVDMRKYII